MHISTIHIIITTYGIIHKLVCICMIMLVNCYLYFYVDYLCVYIYIFRLRLTKVRGSPWISNVHSLNIPWHHGICVVKSSFCTSNPQLSPICNLFFTVFQYKPCILIHFVVLPKTETSISYGFPLVLLWFSHGFCRLTPHEWKPGGPWVRISSALEPGGIPGRDVSGFTKNCGTATSLSIWENNNDLSATSLGIIGEQGKSSPRP